jgi:hypothetical protein
MAEKEKPVKKKPTKKKKEPAKKKKETVEKKKEPKKKESIKKDSIKKEPKTKKENKIVVEITPAEKENNEEMYSSKLKNLLFKIKNQNSFNDTGIRFAWRN